MNQVANQLNILGGNIRQGFAQQGRNREAMAALGLKEQQVDADIAHRKLQEPALRLGGMKAQQEIDDLNAPVSVWDLTPNGDLDSLRHATWQPNPQKVQAGEREDEPSVLDKVQHMIGARLDTDENSDTYRRLVKNDGKVMTRGEFQKYAPQVAELFVFNMDPVRSLRDRGEKIELVAMAGGGGNDQLNAEHQQIQAVLNSPAEQMKQWEKFRSFVSRFSGAEAEKATARADRKIARLEGQISKADDRAHQKGVRKEQREYQEGVRADDQRFRRQLQQDGWDHQKALREEERTYQKSIRNDERTYNDKIRKEGWEREDDLRTGPAIKAFIPLEDDPSKAKGYLAVDGSIVEFNEPIAISGMGPKPLKGTPLRQTIYDPMGNPLKTQEQLFTAFKEYGRKYNEDWGKNYHETMTPENLNALGFRLTPEAKEKPDASDGHSVRLPVSEENPPAPDARKGRDGRWYRPDGNGGWLVLGNQQ